MGGYEFDRVLLLSELHENVEVEKKLTNKMITREPVKF